MRGAFGKPQGTVARVQIGQPIMSLRTKEQHKASCLEALRRAKFKFPGRQKVCFFVFRYCLPHPHQAIFHFFSLRTTPRVVVDCDITQMGVLQVEPGGLPANASDGTAFA